MKIKLISRSVTKHPSHSHPGSTLARGLTSQFPFCDLRQSYYYYYVTLETFGFDNLHLMLYFQTTTLKNSEKLYTAPITGPETGSHCLFGQKKQKQTARLRIMGQCSFLHLSWSFCGKIFDSGLRKKNSSREFQ